MSEEEAYISMGASVSNFKKWQKRGAEKFCQRFASYDKAYS